MRNVVAGYRLYIQSLHGYRMVPFNAKLCIAAHILSDLVARIFFCPPKYESRLQHGVAASTVSR